MQLSPGFPANNLDLRYGITDEITAAVSVDSLIWLPVRTEALVLYRFTVDQWDLVPSLGVKGYWSQNEILPTASFAVGRTWERWRPYLGVSGDTKKAAGFFGVTETWDRFSYFAQLDTEFQFGTVGTYNPDRDGSIDLRIFKSAWNYRPTAGVSWRF